MNTTETPRCLSRRMTVNSWLISVSVSALVGSSMIRSFASSDNALAISTICCCATPKPGDGPAWVERQMHLVEEFLRLAAPSPSSR